MFSFRSSPSGLLLFLEKKWGDAGKYLLDAAVSEEDLRIVKSMFVD